MSITLNITPETLDQLTWEQWELLDNITDKPNFRAVREIMSIFVEGMSEIAAMEVLGKLKTSQMKDVFEQFAKKITEVGAVNPTRGGS
jgi:hypothetical protein